ncbi:uncharacterized protein LOC134189920 [Corticium candelabrum]|uniref:uncharacterized protein LOC134189920 n=1 Tax=Corticium candelabrum TaxID=121492 RepID=UPI002E275FA4|nr:uncharacterized protein LOC134189920 [Corticium candelabrum]
MPTFQYHTQKPGDSDQTFFPSSHTPKVTIKTNTRQTENQLNLLEAGAHAGVSEEKLHEVVHKMKELITSRGDKLLLEAQAFYGSKVEDAEKRGNFELSALQQTNDHLRNSLEEMTLAFENLIFQRQRKEQRINEMHEQVQKMLNDKVLLTRDDTDCEVADEVDRFYGMVLQAQNELT